MKGRTEVKTLCAAICAILLIMVSGCCERAADKPEQKLPKTPGKPAAVTALVLSKDDVLKVLTDCVPADGSVVTGSSVVIAWDLPGTAPGKATIRKKGETARLPGETAWRELPSPSGQHHAVTVDGLNPGEEYEYEVSVELPAGVVQGGKKSFSVSKGLAFTNRQYDFTVKRDYEQRNFVEVVNNDVSAHQLKVSIKNDREDIFIGFIGAGSGDKLVDVAPGEKKTVDLAIFAQDAGKGEYTFAIGLSSVDMPKPIGDSAIVRVRVDEVKFDIGFTVGEVNPVTLGTALRIVNKGDTLTDVTISAADGLEGKVAFTPQTVHAKLDKGASMKVTAAPILEAGMKQLAGTIVLSAAGQGKKVPLKFTVPDGKQVYCATTRSVFSAIGSSWFCTNRPKVKEGLDTNGDGPAKDMKSKDGDGKEDPNAPKKDGEKQPGKDEGGLNVELVAGVGADSPDMPKMGQTYRPGDTVHVPPGGVVCLGNEGSSLQISGGSNGTSITINEDMLQGPASSPFQGISNVLGKLTNKEVGPPSACPGVRNKSIRPEISHLRPDLLQSSVREPFVLSSHGTTVAVWHSNVTRDVEIYFAKIGQGQPMKTTRLTHSKGVSWWPYITSAGENEYLVAWEDGRDGGKPEVYLKKSSDGGNTWSEDRRLTNHGKGIYDPVIWCTGDTVIVAWEDTRGGIYSRKSEDGGKTWKEEKKITSGAVEWPQLAGTKEALWAAWTLIEGDKAAIYIAKSADVGETWSEPVKISGETPSAGEPSILVTKQGIFASWRDSRNETSEIYFRSSADGAKWNDEVRVTNGAVYSEYPSLISSVDGLTVLFCTPAADVNYRAFATSKDGGKTWDAPIRIPAREPNVLKAYFVTNFGLPWDEGQYRKHDVHLRINGFPIADLLNVIPKGRYIFDVNPLLLNHNPGGLGRQEIDFDTVHLNGGHYVVTSDFAIITSLTHNEQMVVAGSQAEADALAAGLSGPGVNHALADVAVFTNKVKGMPDDLTKPGKIALEVEVVNIGAVTADDVVIFVAKGTDGTGEKLGAEVKLDPVPSCGSRTAGIAFDYDGTVFEAAIVVKCGGTDANPENNVWTFKMGKAETGTLQIKGAGNSEVVVSVQSTGVEVAKFNADAAQSLPVGVYRAVVKAGKTIVKENVAVKGGVETHLNLENIGILCVKALEDFNCDIIPEEGGNIVKKRCNQDLSLASGFYTVKIDEGGAGAVVVKDVLVETGKTTNVAGGTSGRLTVNAEGTWPVALLDPVSGEKIYKGTTNNSILAKAGVYDVRVEPEGLKPVTKRMIRIPAGEDFRFDLSGYGKVSVSSINNEWCYRVFSGEQVIADGRCWDTRVVPVGTYTVKFRPGNFEELVFDDVRVLGGRTTALKVTGFGKVGVSSINNEWTYRVLSGEKVIVENRCWDPIIVPVGTYTIKFKPGGYDEITFDNVTVAEGETTKLNVTGFGKVGVSAINGDWRYRVLSGEQEIVENRCWDPIIVPVGTYTVKFKPGKFDEITFDNVTVAEGGTAKLSVTGFGKVGVSSTNNEWRYRVLSGEKEIVENRCWDPIIVPVGTYTVKFKPGDSPEVIFKDILVEEGKTTTIKSGH